MFGNIANRFVSTIASAAALVFSSYQGNEAAFSDIMLQRNNELLTVQCELQSAFDHDFEEFFRSGETINVWFMLQMRSHGGVILEEFYYHSVKYDPLTMYFELYLHDQQFNITTQSYNELVETISHFDHTVSTLDMNTGMNDLVEVSITAYLTKIQMPTMSKPFDMMLLWNFKRPVIKRRFVLNELET